MAGCFGSCWGSFTDEVRKLRRPVYVRGRAFKRARYNEKQVTIEFENLIDEDDFEPRPRRLLTEDEQKLISERKYNQLAEQQKRIDAEIDARLKKQEDDLRIEEEAYYEAKREASKAARQAKSQGGMSNGAKTAPFSSVLDDVSLSSWKSDVSVTSSNLDEEDFDAFLEKVKARSLSSKPAVSLSSGVATLPTESWESALEATRIAGKSLDSFTHPSTEDGSKDTDR
ncbi:AP-1 complex-associated regulatory protein [Nematostella vectensis]|uniref:AP-1 complex-associated regulatory protein n=1 Tax=Nematostella vectensis TaxID=45351 RepID=UPI00138FB673|nr:AP-1 complex-associated regulatory protein [Nematostella vectensis]